MHICKQRVYLIIHYDTSTNLIQYFCLQKFTTFVTVTLSLFVGLVIMGNKL